MTGAYIRGVGLNCALGEHPEDCITAMQRMQVRPIDLHLDDFNEPLRMPYYRIPDTADLFDSRRFQRLLPPVARMAVTQSDLSAAEIRRLPLFVGSSCFSIGLSESQYAGELVRDPAAAMPMPLCGGYQLIAGIIQQELGIQGDFYTYNTACTSSANALLGALRMLELGWYPHALVIGAELANRTTLAGFSGLQIVADRLQPFDVARAGIVLGEGVGAVLLSAQPGAGNPMRLIGGASNCDTWSVTTANPDGNSVASVLTQALAAAGVQPQQIRGIKAHGTATTMGDTAEAIGIRQVFPTPPPVSVLKSYVGHTLGACSVNELVLFGGALQLGFLPATAGFETPDPALGLQPVTTPGSAPDGYYLLNHFGFGGNNAVLVLEKSAS
ncbi:MAG: beta-ketoacyl synthase N-terminal-like domain-containing protein [Gammaproteobacteria bacterium]